MKRRRFVIAGTAAALSAGFALWYRARGKAPMLPAESPLERDPKQILDLLPGFRYRVVERYGAPMDDGYRVPARPDAMGCFDLGGDRWALMRNHELDAGALAYGPYPQGTAVPPQAYDPRSAGGVTRVVLDTLGQRVSSNLVLTGTARNCAGGLSPWGWLTCEESVEPGHGYVFLCSIQADGVRQPQRISAYGRFLHEAAAIDAATSTAYLTEDRQDGCLYRFVPNDPKLPFGAGRLQAMAIVGKPAFELGRALAANATMPVHWIDVPPEEGERGDKLRYVAVERGAPILRRGEGIVALKDGFAITSTSGGPKRAGQIFHLAPTESGGTLRLLAQSEDESTLDMPDNITVMPSGDLLVCEDNQRDAHLRVITRDGRVLPFAHNAISRSELAGVCFSPDGRYLFVNIQEDGLTLAITGPWETVTSSQA